MSHDQRRHQKNPESDAIGRWWNDVTVQLVHLPVTALVETYSSKEVAIAVIAWFLIYPFAEDELQDAMRAIGKN